MHMKILTSTLLLAFIVQGCRNASFENIKTAAIQLEADANGRGPGDGSDNLTPGKNPNDQSSREGPSTGNPNKDDSNALPDPNPNPNPNPNPITKDPAVPATVTLTADVSSPSVKPGKKTVKAKAKFNEKPDVPDVSWSIEPDPTIPDPGTIGADGTYTSPANNKKQFTIKLVATLKSDPKIKASVPLIVTEDDQIFARCTRGSVAFPIAADVYQLNSSATKLPDYGNVNEAKKVTTVCMENYAVSPRDFSTGFPDVTSLDEWFSLKTQTTLVITQAGEYEFEMNSDDGSRLYIDGKEVIDNDGLHNAYGPGPEESLAIGRKFVKLTLTAGDHDLKLNYFQGPRLRIALELKWKKPGSSSFVYVPRESFR
ncbi:MAG: hypothetical protein EOP10_01895 [Proteobacteria bacterium]|nr:MAG: hypothetical protein EOP10_01895 [Pseudomonadota bacterium]